MGFGSKENQDVNAKFVRFEDFFGEQIEETGEGGDSGDLGVDLVFRTGAFDEEEGKAITSLAKESRMTAKGSWAVTAK